MHSPIYRRILAAVAVYALMWCLTYVTSCKNMGPNGKCLDNYLEDRGRGFREIISTARTEHADHTEPSKPSEHVEYRTKMPEVYSPFKKALKYGKRRSHKGYITIGVPTMKRPAKQTYLWQTLDSLLFHLKEGEKNQTVIVIFLSDFDEASKESLSAEILQKYNASVDSGLIQIIEAPRDYYPPLTNLKRTYGHPMKKVIWRSKQNIDYAFMMKYSADLSQYYLQLEDDVTTVPSYIFKIQYFIKQVERKSRWVCLEFSQLGYIGKLYHSEDLEKLANLLTLFYNEQPNDVTYLHFNQLMLQWHRKVIRPTIFQHHGYHSTLEIKKSAQKDKLFIMRD